MRSFVRALSTGRRCPGCHTAQARFRGFGNPNIVEQNPEYDSPRLEMPRRPCGGSPTHPPVPRVEARFLDFETRGPFSAYRTLSNKTRNTTSHGSKYPTHPAEATKRIRLSRRSRRAFGISRRLVHAPIYRTLSNKTRNTTSYGSKYPTLPAEAPRASTRPEDRGVLLGSRGAWSTLGLSNVIELKPKYDYLAEGAVERAGRCGGGFGQRNMGVILPGGAKFCLDDRTDSFPSRQAEDAVCASASRVFARHRVG